MKVKEILMVLIGILSLIIFYKIYKGSLIEGVESGDITMCHTNQPCPGVTCPPGGTKDKPVLCPSIITEDECNEQCDERCDEKKKTCPKIDKITINQLKGEKHKMSTHIRNNAENAPTRQMLNHFWDSGIVVRYLQLRNLSDDSAAIISKYDTLVQDIFNSIQLIMLNQGYDDATYLKLYNDYIKHETEFYDEFIKDRINNYMDKQKNDDGKYQGFQIKDD